MYTSSNFHFTGNKNEADGRGKNFDTLLIICNVFKILNMIFSKFYNSSEHLAADDVIVLFKGKVIFTQCIPKEHKSFSIQIHKPHNSTGHVYDVKLLVEGQTIHDTVTELTSK
jgi:hypothetical protein